MRNQAPRLHFSDEEHATPELKKPIERVDKAAVKADKAQAKIPTKKALKPTATVDPKTGRMKVKLQFEESKKKLPSKLTHAVQSAPGEAVRGQLHRQIAESEDDNVGVEAAHKLEEAAESGGRLVQSGYRSHQLQPYRAATRAENQLDKANLSVLQKKAQVEQPTSNPVSKWQQKQAIKRQYAAAKSGKTAETAKKPAKQPPRQQRKRQKRRKKQPLGYGSKRRALPLRLLPCSCWPLCSMPCPLAALSSRVSPPASLAAPMPPPTMPSGMQKQLTPPWNKHCKTGLITMSVTTITMIIPLIWTRSGMTPMF